MNSYFSFSDKVYDVTEKYPVLIQVLAGAGFENLKNDMMRKTMGKLISLEQALKMKGIDQASMELQMVEAIAGSQEQKNDDNGVFQRGYREAEGSIKGVLPCPVRMQFIDALKDWETEHRANMDVRLQSASMGIAEIEEEVSQARDAKDLSDVYLSAGFELFFDKEKFGKFQEEGCFYAARTEYNKDFDNASLSLKDPRGNYTILGVVPAIFVVNKKALGDRKVPESWRDLFTEEFERSVTLPTGDLDMFNALMLGIYSRYGKDGVYRLGRALTEAMHPATMVKEENRGGGRAAAVSIMPYFFSKMIRENPELCVVWPKDGAVLSPIFLLTKKEHGPKAGELIDFLTSLEAAEVLGADGKFPQTRADYENGLGEDQKFLWCGWDFLYNHDIGPILKQTEAWFEEGRQA